jgi:DNA-binding CsgD family transcriptional regulator
MVWSFERAEADIAQLSEQALDKDDFCWAAGERIARAVHFDASCWHTHDPATLLITSHITERLPFCRFELLAHNEYAADDVNLFTELATSRRRVRTLRGATRNRPDRSERYRELFVPNGLDAELRAALVDGGSCWGGLIVARDTGRPDFSSEETSFLSRLSRPLARGMRSSILTAAAHRERGPDAPGLIVLDPHGEVDAVSESAIAWLQELDEGVDELPSSVLSTAEAARRAGPGETPIRSRVRTAAGRWVVLHGSRIADATDRVTVIIAPATPMDVVALLLGAYGLTARESEVADLVMRGQSNAQVSAALSITPYTVQDHLKAIFEKVGVHSRKDLMGHVFFKHFLPRIADHATPAANGMLL